MKAKNIIKKTRPIWKFLPYGSFVNWATKKDGLPLNFKDIPMEITRCLAHVAYLGIPAVLGTRYINNGLTTDSWSPFEQRRINVERKAEQADLQERYAQLEQRIFGTENGLADTDYNGELSPREKLTAYENMDLDSIIVLPARKPTIQELERAEHLYKTQRAKENENFRK